jgi:hypothetical protein
MCECAEGKIVYKNGRGTIDIGLGRHDCEYISRRNQLIEHAEHYATQETGDRVKNTSKWSIAFHRHMNHLAKAQKL